jgi:LCP family protein required for cell wall assembly
MSRTSPTPSGGRFRRTLLVVAATLSFLMAAGSTTAFAGYVWAQKKLSDRGTEFGGGVDTGGTEPATQPGGAIGGECKDSCNYLVLGSDSRAGLSAKDQKGFQSDAQIGGYRSDTMMLVHIDGETKHATIVSFPRDLLVDIPGYGKNKINASFSLGAENGRGIEGAANLTAKTVAALTGLDINHFMVVDLAGFQAIVDAIQGVPFCTPVKLVDDPSQFPDFIPGEGGSGLYLDAGCHVLDGPTALALVRARHVIAGGVKDCVSDYARISRQQQFMRALMNKLLSPSELGRAPTLIDVVSKQLTFDRNLKIPELVDLSKAMQGVASGNADFRTVPNELGWADIGGVRASVLTVTPEGRQFLGKLASGESLGDLGTQLEGQAPSPANIAVRVYDANSEGHAQDDVYTAQLSEAGFKMMATSAEAAGDLAGSTDGKGAVILYAKGFEEEAKVVAGYVPGYPIELAKAGDLPEDTHVGVVVDASYRHKDPGQGKTSTVNPDCPYA